MKIEKPLIFESKNQAPAGAEPIDAFEGAVRELFFVENPSFKKEMPEAKKALDDFLNNHNIKDIFIYYPWENKLARCLPEDLYFKLRTTRNRNIITQEEQINYRNAKVGVVGLSVGFAIVSALAMSGGPKVLKIADFDEVEVSNLNRIKAGLLDVGMNKTTITAKEIWELDPFADLYLWDKGVSRENIKDFIAGEPKLDVFIDEMDSIDLKILSRLICREFGIPVLMATDNGDSVILDVERFDLEPQREIFHGLIGNAANQDLKNLDYKQWLKLAMNIVGPEYMALIMSWLKNRHLNCFSNKNRGMLVILTCLRIR